MENLNHEQEGGKRETSWEAGGAAGFMREGVWTGGWIDELRQVDLIECRHGWWCGAVFSRVGGWLG